jgi:hypothetical protein
MIRHTLRVLCVLAFTLVAIDRLPAPIVEESPTPKPKAVAKKKTDNDDATKPKSEAKAKQSPLAPFVGIWSGPVTGTLTSDGSLPSTEPQTNVTTFRVLNDGTITDKGGQFRAVPSPDGRTLSWSGQATVSGATGRAAYSMQLVGPNSGIFQFNFVLTFSGGGHAVMKGSGTLTKQ